MPDGGGRTALVVVDVLNAYEHEDADRLATSVRETLPHLRRLLDAARERDLLRVYVNDNFDDWTLDRAKLVQRALAGRQQSLVEPLVPDDDVALLLKGRHSIFWETPLAYLLRRAEVGHIVLCGQVTEQCILYSAFDAHVRHFSFTVVPEACAHIHADLADAALRLMELNMNGRIASVDEAFRS